MLCIYSITHSDLNSSSLHDRKYLEEGTNSEKGSVSQSEKKDNVVAKFLNGINFGNSVNLFTVDEWVKFIVE